MKLESIRVNNIRSIENLDLEFPESTVLFFGDVGSGKSSVLKSIEFGLFGTLGDLPAESLLRRGKKKGSVELTFSIDDKIYTIYRALQRVIRKGEEKIEQPKGWFIKDAIKTEYPTTDLRLKILDLLNYSISRYKAHNKKCIDIYRYTVYTPQEEIKAILEANPDERFNILKDVLEIEKYEYTLSNLDKICKKLNHDVRNLESKIRLIGSPEEEIPIKKDEIATHESLISSKKKDISITQNKLNKEKKIQEAIQEEYNEFSKKLGEVTTKKKIVQDNNASLNDNQSKIKTLKNELSKKQEELESLPKIELKSKKTKDEIETEIKDFRKEEKEFTKRKANLEKDKNEIEELLRSNKCPRCKQEIHEKERFNNELSDITNAIPEISGKLEEVTKQINKREELLEAIQKYEMNLEKKKSLNEIIKEKLTHQDDLKKTISGLEKAITQSQEEIDNIFSTYKIKSLEEFKAYEKKIKSKLDDQKVIVDDIQKELTELEKQETSFKAQLDTLKQQVKKLEESIEFREKLREKSVCIKSVSEWVSDQLPILIRDIERTILSATAYSFDMYFKDWFRVLVQEEDIEIRIDPENLQPIVYIDGYESPFNDMSGGEKSALSLAYRLALNKVINSKHQDVKTKDLLILDEPTDGFSEAQVSKMQHVFDSLNMKQMIVISHERTLDSFVSDIFNFTKVNHKTNAKRES